jgi:hypothetical protein
MIKNARIFGGSVAVAAGYTVVSRKTVTTASFSTQSGYPTVAHGQRNTLGNKKTKKFSTIRLQVVLTVARRVTSVVRAVSEGLGAALSSEGILKSGRDMSDEAHERFCFLSCVLAGSASSVRNGI